MDISVENARRIAEEYVSKKADLPKDVQITRGFERNDRWNFKLRWRPPDCSGEFDIMYLSVDDEGTLFEEDRREEVGIILANPQGIAREDRLIRAVTDDRVHKPWWLLKMKRTKPFMDRKGIDGFAVTYLDDNTNGTLSMSFQVKSSKEALKQYFRSFPRLVGITTGIIVHDFVSDEDLVKEFIKRLTETRNRITSGQISVIEFKRALTDHITNAAV